MTPATALACAVVGVVAAPLLARVIDRVPRKEKVFGATDRQPPRRVVIVVGVAAAVLAGAVGARFAGDWALPAFLVFAGSLLVITAIDLEHYVIPNRVVYPTIAIAVPLLGLAALVDGEGDRLVRALIGAAAAWAMLLVVHLISPRGMGFGDVRLAFVIGLYLGWLGSGHVILGLFLGFLLGSVAGLSLLVARRRSRKEAIPFGPFLAAGAMLAVLFGGPLIDWYNG